MYNPPEHQASWQEAGSPNSQQRSLYGRQFPPGHQEFSENISSFAMKTQSMVLPDTPDSTEEAFRLINAGVEAEEDRRFAAAMRHFLDAGEMLTRVGEQEPDQHVRNLLHQKAMDVLGWTEALANWTDNGRMGPVPRRMGRCVAADVIHRLSPSVHAPVLPTDTLEFRTMYYTAVSTKRVDDFTRDGYVLKTIQYGRRPKLMVVITMYNEDENELAFTLRKVANNVQYIQQMKLPGYQDDNAWQNVLVCIVSDGRTKANKGTLSWLNKTGAFDEEAMTINSVGTDVQMHLFEYSMQLLHHKVSRGVGGGVRIEEKNERYPPLQVVFALKEYNGGKLNSHEWYFNAFAEQVMPKYTILLDVGTMPTKSAFYRLLAAMEGNPKIGGVCGEIAVDRPIPNLCNFVIAAQHYEYKVSNILDKSMESVFGFISVLPGAFSAYRYEAIRGEPLRAYFKSLTTSMKELGPFQGNMYLAEDRILCFEIVAKANCKWTLHYVKNAIARTDVPTNLVALIGQRRRWLNGSFFAILYTVAFWGRIYSESGHSYFRKAAFMVQYTYNCITVLLNWLLVGNFYLAIYFVVIRAMYNNSYPEFMKVDEFPTKWKDLISNLFQFSYAVIFLLQILAGLGNKPKHIPWIYTVAAAYFGLVMAVAFVVATLIFIFQDTFSTFTIVFAIAIVGVYFIAAALHCEVHHIFMTILQYFAMLPTMINILNVYSFCNLHDLSWGTKGLESGGGHGPKAGDKKGTYEDVVAAQKAAEEKARKEAAEKDMLEKQFNGFRLKLLFLWLLSNMAFVFGVQLYVDANSYLTVLYVVIGAFNVWRLIGSAAYLVTYLGDKLYAMLFLRRRLRKEDIREREMRYRASVQAHRQMGGPGAPPPGGYQIFETPLSKEPQLQP